MITLKSDMFSSQIQLLVNASSIHKITFKLGNNKLIDNQKYEMTLSLSLNAFDYGSYKLH